MDTQSIKQQKIDRLRRRIEKLEAENTELKRQNNLLRAREDAVNDLSSTYTELIKELREIRDRYSCALRDTIEMRKHFQNEFKKKIKAIKEV